MMTFRLQKLSRRQSWRRGQSTVEMALILPVLLLLLMGVVDLGRAFIANNMIANVAREGARYGTIPTRTSNEIVTYANTKIAIGGVTVSVVSRGTPRNVADPVVVSAAMTFSPITPLINQVCCSGGPINLTARSSMVVE